VHVTLALGDGDATENRQLHRRELSVATSRSPVQQPSHGPLQTSIIQPTAQTIHYSQKLLLLLLFYGHYKGQPVLAGTNS